MLAAVNHVTEYDNQRHIDFILLKKWCQEVQCSLPGTAFNTVCIFRHCQSCTVWLCKSCRQDWGVACRLKGHFQQTTQVGSFSIKSSSSWWLRPGNKHEHFDKDISTVVPFWQTTDCFFLNLLSHFARTVLLACVFSLLILPVFTQLETCYFPMGSL